MVSATVSGGRNDVIDIGVRGVLGDNEALDGNISLSGKKMEEA